MRGIDFQGASHVVIFDFPTSAAEYIHMAGRTARAGADGALCAWGCQAHDGLLNEFTSTHLCVACVGP